MPDGLPIEFAGRSPIKRAAHTQLIKPVRAHATFQNRTGFFCTAAVNYVALLGFAELFTHVDPNSIGAASATLALLQHLLPNAR